MKNKILINRRDFLSITSWTIGGFISAGIVIPPITYIIGPALHSDKTQSWSRLGSTSKTELGTRHYSKLRFNGRLVGLLTVKNFRSMRFRMKAVTPSAVSNVCAHLGCRARWVSDREQFYWPCHAGVCDREGDVVSGPPPRPLDRYEVKVENGQLFIRQLYMVEA